MSAAPMTARALGIKTRRQKIAEAGGMRCFYCAGALTMAMGQSNTATVDHKRPKSRGGTSAHANLVAACMRCNQLKGALTAGEFRALYPVIARRSHQHERQQVRKVIMAGDGRWRPDDRAGFRASDMGLDSPPLIGLADLWPTPTGRAGG